MKRVFSVASLLALIAGASCAKSEAPAIIDSAAIASVDPLRNDVALSPGEGRLRVDGGRIWYRVAGAGRGVPVILLHSGPGLNSYALKSLEELGNDRPVVRYDQLGGGKSDNLNDTTKMNIARFVAELEALRAQLGYDKVHLIGHAWGATLALEYSRAHPEHVVSMTLAGARLDMPSWKTGVQRLVASLPDSSRKAVAASEADGHFNSPEYRAAIADYFQRFMWRKPVVDDVDSASQHVDQILFEYMHGPSEFTVLGTLKDYDATPFLNEVKVPTLYVVGEFDEALPSLVRKYVSLTPGARYSSIAGAAHFISWDNPVATTMVIRDFLGSVDRANAGTMGPAPK